MQKKQKEKKTLIVKWLKKEVGNSASDYICLPPRFRHAYKRLFNLKWRVYKSKSLDEKKILSKSLHEIYGHILKIHVYEARRRKFIEKKKRKNSKYTSTSFGPKMTKLNIKKDYHNVKPKKHVIIDKEPINVTYKWIKKSLRTNELERLNNYRGVSIRGLRSSLFNYGKTSRIVESLLTEHYGRNKEAAVTNTTLNNCVLNASEMNSMLIFVTQMYIRGK